ncbi:MAG: hypothetical protein CM1200mP20_11000 [Pseudomonadota bacterium]|nr:MAG: hypothetical protein CM1200mP20_11000 [Pseudomonadota bacterium]
MEMYENGELQAKLESMPNLSLWLFPGRGEKAPRGAFWVFRPLQLDSAGSAIHNRPEQSTRQTTFNIGQTSDQRRSPSWVVRYASRVPRTRLCL